MCICIYQPAGIVVSDDKLRNSYENNSDGMGFAYISTDYAEVKRLKIVKTMDYDTFLRKYKRAVLNNPESPFLIHFRIATHGTVDKFNCHPFKINKRMAFIHNGVISGIEVDKVKSDTQVFNDKFLKTLPKGWETNEACKILIEKFIVGSKLITLNIDGTTTIYNESSGHWKDGCWFSNNSYSYKKSPYAVVVVKGGSRYYPQSTNKIAESYYCDDCGCKLTEFTSNFFMRKDIPVCLCQSCKTTAIFEKRIKIQDGVSKYRYLKELEEAQDFYSYTGAYGRFME